MLIHLCLSGLLKSTGKIWDSCTKKVLRCNRRRRRIPWITNLSTVALTKNTVKQIPKPPSSWHDCHITHQMSSKRRLSLGSLLHLHYWHQARTDCSHKSSSQQCTLRGEVSWNSRSTLITIWTIGITWHNIAEHKAWKTSLEQHLMAKSLEAQVLEGVVVSKIEEPFGGFLGASPSIWWGILRSYPSLCKAISTSQ